MPAEQLSPFVNVKCSCGDSYLFPYFCFNQLVFCFTVSDISSLLIYDILNRLEERILEKKKSLSSSLLLLIGGRLYHSIYSILYSNRETLFFFINKVLLVLCCIYSFSIDYDLPCFTMTKLSSCHSPWVKILKILTS